MYPLKKRSVNGPLWMCSLYKAWTSKYIKIKYFKTQAVM